MTGHRLLARQSAIITGAGAGLARAQARLLASLGASVVVNDISGKADEVVGEIVGAGGVAVPSGHDVSVYDEAAALVDLAIEAFGHVDTVVASAAIIRPVSFLEMSVEEFEATMRVNAYGQFNVLHRVWPHLMRQGFGRVVMVGSSAAWVPLLDSSHYAASKGAVLGLATTLAAEGRDRGITVNVLAPGALTQMSGADQVDDDDPIRVTRAPELVAPVVAWLVRRENELNGKIIEAAGGRVALDFIGSTAGFWSRDLTVDDLVDAEPRIMSLDDFTVLSDNDALQQWMARNTGWPSPGPA